jgi:hypothetical protein
MTSATVRVIRQGWACDDLCLDPPGWTVIQVARGTVSDGETLVLVDLAPTMPYLSESTPTVLGICPRVRFLTCAALVGSRLLFVPRALVCCHWPTRNVPCSVTRWCFWRDRVSTTRA